LKRQSIIKSPFFFLALWLVPMIFCAAIVIYLRTWYPELFSDLLSEVLQTFSPQIAIILGFIYSDRIFQNSKRFLTNHYFLAIILSSVYIIAFVILIIQLFLHRTYAAEVISTFQFYRVALGFLIDGVLIFIFASRE